MFKFLRIILHQLLIAALLLVNLLVAPAIAQEMQSSSPNDASVLVGTETGSPNVAPNPAAPVEKPMVESPRSPEKAAAARPNKANNANVNAKDSQSKSPYDIPAMKQFYKDLFGS